MFWIVMLLLEFSTGTFFISKIYQSVSFDMVFLMCGVSLLLLFKWGFECGVGFLMGLWQYSGTPLQPAFTITTHNNLVEEIPC